MKKNILRERLAREDRRERSAREKEHLAVVHGIPLKIRISKAAMNWKLAPRLFQRRGRPRMRNLG